LNSRGNRKRFKKLEIEQRKKPKKELNKRNWSKIKKKKQ
jgi:hypothetical protein